MNTSTQESYIWYVYPKEGERGMTFAYICVGKVRLEKNKPLMNIYTQQCVLSSLSSANAYTREK